MAVSTVNKMSKRTLNESLVIAIASRALFNLDDSHRIFEQQGIEAYCQYQIDNEENPLDPGVAYGLVQKLLRLNALEENRIPIEVILMSRNSADTGLRIFRSIEEHKLEISRAVFTSGRSPFPYISAFDADLFLSTNPEDVTQALETGVAAATILGGPGQRIERESLHIAFDGDAVIFSDEAERIYKSEGLEKFTETERQAAKLPLSGGPFKNFLSALHQIQKQFPADSSPIRTALVTARSAPAHERVVRTLRAWDIRIDEAIFLGGLPKGEFLRAFGADIFFDDQHVHCESSKEHVGTGHVPHGIANQP